jgi:hypothetical protein
MVAILVGGLGRRTQISKRIIWGPFHHSLGPIGPAVSEKIIFKWFVTKFSIPKLIQSCIQDGHHDIYLKKNYLIEISEFQAEISWNLTFYLVFNFSIQNQVGDLQDHGCLRHLVGYSKGFLITTNTKGTCQKYYPSNLLKNWRNKFKRDHWNISVKDVYKFTKVFKEQMVSELEQVWIKFQE